MEVKNKNSVELLEALVEDRNNEDCVAELLRRIEAGDTTLGDAAKEVQAAHPEPEGPIWMSPPGPSWSNYIGQQKCFPRGGAQPVDSLEKVISYVNKARE